MDNQSKNYRFLRTTLIAVVFVGFGILSIVAYKNPKLFRAELGGGTEIVPAGYTLYIPNDYTMQANDVGVIEVKAATDIDDFDNFNITLHYTPEKMSINQLTAQGGDAFSGLLPAVISSTTNGTFSVTYDNANLQLPTPIPVAAGQTLFHLSVELVPGFTSGQTSISATFGPTTFCPHTSNLSFDDYFFCAKVAGTYITTPTFRDGKITVSSGGPLDETDTCLQLGDCSGHGYCDGTQCVCDPGFSGARCNTCDTGFSGYPQCEQSALEAIDAFVLTLNPTTIAQLPPAERKQAYSSVYLFLNSSDAAGRTITVEGTPITIPAPNPAITIEADKINSIINDPDGDPSTNDGLKHLLAVAGVNVTNFPEIYGLLKLSATEQNADHSLDGISSTSGEVTIVPGLEYTLNLPPSASYRLRILAKKNNGSMTELNFNDVVWQPQPMNRLDNEALNGGLLERGDEAGIGPVYAQIEQPSGPSLSSLNQLAVEVPAGPVIEYVRRIGSTPLVKGGRLTLSVKVSDVHQITDISDIRTSIVRSSGITYADINSDANAVWFTATPFEDEVTVTDSGSEGETQAPRYFKIYQIPVEIPQDPNLTDGGYHLVLSIADASNFQTNAIFPLTIGAVASGDVNGDGRVSMLDVIMGFQIASGNLTPTPRQLQAADVTGDGRITMLDVVTLFNRVNQ